MIKQRAISASILLAITLALIFLLPTKIFNLVCAALIVFSSWEWAKISGWNKIWQQLVYCLSTGLLIFLSQYSSNRMALVGVGITWWLIAILLIKDYPKSKDAWCKTTLKLIIGWLVLIPTWTAIVILKDKNTLLLLYLLSLVWIADITAYFFGMWFGCNKLAPAISPKKTWQGVIGGFLSITIFSVAVTWIAKYSLINQLAFIFISLLTFAISVIGDLLESIFKRESGLKDSGNIIPGHGGIMDRIDSLTAAAPVFTFLLSFITLG